MSDVLDLTGKTFGELMLDLAMDVGLAELVDDAGVDIEPRLPTDPSRLAKLRMKVNDGYMAFLGSIDPAGKVAPYTNWAFLNRDVVINLNPDGAGHQNIAGDNARYRLPAGVRNNPPFWELESDGAFSTESVENRLPRQVTNWLANDSIGAGCPTISCCRPIDNPEGATAGGAWEVVVAPRPSIAMTMTGHFRLQPRRMQHVDEKHLCGSLHDGTIRLFALVEWARVDNKFASQRDDFARQASAALASSIANDRKMHTSSVGHVTDPSVCAVAVNRGTVAAGQRGIVEYAG